MSPESLGFTDFPRDPDDVMRRQRLVMGESSACPTNQSLSFRIALAYLAQLGVPPMRSTPAEDRQIGDVIIEAICC